MKPYILLHRVKSSICISNFIQTTLFYLGRFVKKLADNQFYSITKGIIYRTKHIYIHPFSMEVVWLKKFEVWGKYLLGFIFANTAILLGMSALLTCEQRYKMTHITCMQLRKQNSSKPTSYTFVTRKKWQKYCKKTVKCFFASFEVGRSIIERNMWTGD